MATTSKTQDLIIQDGEVERKATAEETKYIKEWQAELVATTETLLQEINDKETNKQKAITKLKTLGLTEEEINAIL